MHSHSNSRGKRLLTAVGLNFLITVVQVLGGILSNSLSLISDALHNLSDGTALLIAWIAGRYARRQPNMRQTFGYRRAEILAALINGIILIGVTLFLFVEAYHRFLDPQPIKGRLMVAVATIGLLANLAAVLLLHKHSRENINLRAAYLHLFADTLSSIAVILGGALMWIYGWYWIDPLITVLIGVYILRETYGILKETTLILMQSSPADLDLALIRDRIESLPQVRNLHHVHVWRLDDEQTHFEGHVSMESNLALSEANNVRESIESLLLHEFDIDHVTLQMEYNEECLDGIIADTSHHHKHN